MDGRAGMVRGIKNGTQGRECCRACDRFARNGSYEYRNRRSSHKPDPQENRLGLHGLKVIEPGGGRLGVSGHGLPLGLLLLGRCEESQFLVVVFCLVWQVFQVRKLLILNDLWFLLLGAGPLFDRGISGIKLDC